MGHREQLMVGAKRCLQERGYARTTSRDIAAAADNAPVGTINYHYGSKDALLNAALLEVLHEWGEKAMRPEPDVSAGATTPGGVRERLEGMWARAVDAGVTHRPMLVAATEAFTEAERSPEIRRQIADAYENSRPRLAAELHGITAEDDAETARAVGSVHMALFAGLTQQWLIDPERAPSARDMVIGLRAIADSLENDGQGNDGQGNDGQGNNGQGNNGQESDGA
ncbi:TetR/AcrR family transcriptional regulator [Streptomyces sp. NPDC055078]